MKVWTSHTRPVRRSIAAANRGCDSPESRLRITAVKSAQIAAAKSARIAAANSGCEVGGCDFAAVIRATLPSDQVLGPLAAEVQAQASRPGAAPDTPSTAALPSPSWRVFALRDGLLYRLSPCGDRLCVPCALQTQVLHELHATSLGGHFGRDKTFALARRLVWWPGLPAALEEYVRTCPTCQRVKTDHLPPPDLLYPLPVPTRRGGCMTVHQPGLPRVARRPLRPRLSAGAH